MRGPQDAINQHRSKAMHIMNTRQLKLKEGAVDDVELTRREAARPDGVLVYRGDKNDLDVLQPEQEFIQQTNYYQDAKQEIDGFGPNQQLIEKFGQNVSGRAANALQQAGIAELGPFLKNFRIWKLERYRAAWLAALLTPLARFAFVGPTPLFLCDANVRAVGKGLLLDCISRIVTGEPFTIATFTSDDDELRKRVTSLALGGDRLVLFDNLSGNFGNAVLDAALTGTAWKDRVLGANRMAEAPLYMTWYATGNNVGIAADTARRCCHIRLESAHERPEERTDFDHPNLLAWIGQNRLRLLTAALTILRGYCAAGRPDLHLPAWGSYEGWSALGALGRRVDRHARPRRDAVALAGAR